MCAATGGIAQTATPSTTAATLIHNGQIGGYAMLRRAR